jgi:hypothetical protein
MQRKVYGHLKVSNQYQSVAISERTVPLPRN